MLTKANKSDCGRSAWSHAAWPSGHKPCCKKN